MTKEIKDNNLKDIALNNIIKEQDKTIARLHKELRRINFAIIEHKRKYKASEKEALKKINYYSDLSNIRNHIINDKKHCIRLLRKRLYICKVVIVIEFILLILNVFI